MMRRFLLPVLFFLLAGTTRLAAQQDTLALTLPQAEALFLRNNLSVVASQYNIDAARALQQQAAYWDNPVLVTDQNLNHQPISKFSQNGQVFLQLQQLVRTAGKRNKLVQLATDNTLSAEQQFRDLMRNLRYLLQTRFADALRLQETRRIYLQELEALRRLADGMDAQLAAGNIALKDNVRVKALLYALQADAAAVESDLSDTNRDLLDLLRPEANVVVQAVAAPLDVTQAPMPTLAQLLDSAKANRPDLALARINQQYQQHNLAYQRALAVPDITIAAEYDRLNGFYQNYVGAGINLPLPLFNRNKGNIRAAVLGASQAGVQQQQALDATTNSVQSAFRKYGVSLQLMRNEPDVLKGTFDQLMQNVVRSYQQRQIGLVEFIDFFDSYKDVRIRKLQQEEALRSAAAEINYTTNAPLISFN